MDIITRLKLHSQRAFEAGEKRAEHIARAGDHARAALEICRQQLPTPPKKKSESGVFEVKWAAYQEASKK